MPCLIEATGSLCRLGLQSFFLFVVGVILSTDRGRGAFMDEGHASQRQHLVRYGRWGAVVVPLSTWMISHRAVGAMHFLWLIIGSTLRCKDSDSGSGESPSDWWVFLSYDSILGALGMATTWTAAQNFPHKHVRNQSQSGTLSQSAIVTQDEMMEHFFYQMLNLVQAVYLHLLSLRRFSTTQRFAALALATAPWLVRHRFPVHPFAQNWCKDSRQGQLETLLYRIKKFQYLLYKHFLLHGMNWTAFLRPDFTIFRDSWRHFWICLNASYVLEFFLQSMVKRKALQQSTMLWMNRWLMVLSTLAACLVIWDFPIPWICCGASLVLNLVHRHHDFGHTLVLAGLSGLMAHWRAIDEQGSG